MENWRNVACCTGLLNITVSLLYLVESKPQAVLKVKTGHVDISQVDMIKTHLNGGTDSKGIRFV